MFRHEVAYPDSANLALREKLFEGPVGRDGAIEGGWQRLMQQQQIEMIEAKLTRALLEGVQGLVVPIITDPDLRFDENLVASEAGASNPLANLSLVGVRSCRIDQAIAESQRLGDR